MNLAPVPPDQSSWFVRWGRGLWRIVRIPCIAYAVVVALLAFLQRSIIYGPTKVSTQAMQRVGGEFGAENVEFQSHDDLTLHGWRVPARNQVVRMDDAAEPGRPPVVLFFTGNAGHRAYRCQEFELLSQLGADVYCFDYRGYGENGGSPNEADLARDAHTAWKWLTAEHGITPARVLLFGESLGGGVATRLAAELCERGEGPGGLILRSTFTSLADVAARQFPWVPVRTVLLDRYPSVERISRVTCPILMLHGDQDTLIPLEIGQRLFEAAPASSNSGRVKRFVSLPGAGHNDYFVRSSEQLISGLKLFLRGD